MFADLDYRQGRVDQAQWVVDRLMTYFKTHEDVLEATPSAFRTFLADVMTQGVLEASHGTRSVVAV